MPAFLLPLLVNRYTIGAVIALGLILGAYWKGYSTAAQKCHDAELRAIIASQARDLKAGEDAAKAAADLQSQLAADNIELHQTVQDYEKELLTKPAPDCALDSRDIDRLHSIGKR